MRRLVAVTVVVVAIAAGTLPGAAAPGAQRTLLHYGDSLTVGTDPFLRPFLPGWSIRESGLVGRRSAEARRAIASLGTELPHVLAISLGANDDPRAVSGFAATIERVVALAGPGRCVIWSTVQRPPYDGVSYDGLNRALRRGARLHSTLRVFDWQALASAHPQWLRRDGVHPTASGYRARAAALAKLVTAC